MNVVSTWRNLSRAICLFYWQVGCQFPTFVLHTFWTYIKTTQWPLHHDHCWYNTADEKTFSTLWGWPNRTCCRFSITCNSLYVVEVCYDISQAKTENCIGTGGDTLSWEPGAFWPLGLCVMTLIMGRHGLRYVHWLAKHGAELLCKKENLKRALASWRYLQNRCMNGWLLTWAGRLPSRQGHMWPVSMRHNSLLGHHRWPFYKPYWSIKYKGK